MKSLSFVGIVLVALVVGGISAQPVAESNAPAVYSFSGWSPGTYHVTVVIGEAGEVKSIGALDVVQLPVPGPSTDSVDPVDPVDPTDPLTETVLSIAATAPQANRDAVALLYETTGNVDLPAADQVRQATSVVFSASGLPQEWVDWKAKIDTATASVDDVDQLKALWLAIAKALR